MKNLGLQGKLFLLSGILLVMCALTGIAGYHITQKVVSAYRKIDEYNLPNTRVLLAAYSSNRSMRIQLLRLSYPGAPKEIKENALKKYKKDWKSFDDGIAEYLALPFGPGEKELYANFEPRAKELRALTDKAVETYTNMKDDNDAEGRKKLNELILNDIEKGVGPFKDTLHAMIKYQSESAKTNSAEAQAEKESGTKMLIFLVVAALVIGLTCAYLLSSSLVKAFKEISFSLTQAGSEVTSASEQVASSSQELSQGVHQQAAALQETASSLEELSSTISKNTDTSKEAAGTSKKTQTSTHHGKTVVEEMINSMDDINKSNLTIVDQINQSNKEIGDIVKVITEIGNKTKVINDIVFQTKLLSFNASVEAARAGENGKGFAVVAEEVGNLARMSGTAATEISDMLDESIKSVTRIVQDSQEKVSRMMNDSKVKVEKGTSIAHECGKVFNQIYEDIAIINTISSEISHASAEQSSGVQEISKAMNQLDLATQQSSSVSQQAASAAEQLSAQAASMKLTVDELIRIVDGGRKAA